MAENTLTNLIPSLYAGLDIVSRELVGFIPAVARDATAERAAVGQTVTYHVTGAANVGDTTPAMAIPEPTGQTPGTGTMSISKSRNAEFGVVGEAVKGLNANGAGWSPLQADMFAQAVRALVNEVETDLSVAAAAAASRATGYPGTVPFASSIDDVSQLGKILSDNGAPMSNRSLVLNTTAGAALRTLYGINTDRDFSSMPFNQQGVLVTPQGMGIRESGQSITHTSGTAVGATTDTAGYAVGATTITLASAGTGTILAGDLISFAGDSRKYVVVTGDADVSGGGSIVIQSPGLMQAIPGSATAITVIGRGDVSPDVATYDAAGVAFERNSIVLAARAPALPEEGDAALAREMIVDPRSGLAFEVSVYPGYRKVRYEVALAWGVEAAIPRHIALLAG